MNAYETKLEIKGLGQVPYVDYGAACEDVLERARQYCELLGSEQADTGDLAVLVRVECEDLWDACELLTTVKGEIESEGYDVTLDKARARPLSPLT